MTLIPCDLPAQHEPEFNGVDAEVASFAASVRPVTVRQWARRYQLTVACDLASKRLVYDLAEIMLCERATRRSGRSRRVLESA